MMPLVHDAANDGFPHQVDACVTVAYEEWGAAAHQADLLAEPAAAVQLPHRGMPMETSWGKPRTAAGLYVYANVNLLVILRSSR